MLIVRACVLLITIVYKTIGLSQVIGCQARNSKVMFESVRAGHIMHEASLETLADGTSGDIEDGSVT